ncbi:MAG: transglycosylase SLT domain-containing protein [Bacteroidetes bacterium]|nr:transglycosylase SLT domain-containing protein [Bacteroidota bacterium]
MLNFKSGGCMLWGKFFSPIVVLFICLGGCAKPLDSLRLRAIEGPTDAIQEQVGLIQGPKSIYSALRWSEQYIPTVKTYARKYNVDWVLVLAMMQKESLFDQGAVSERGAIGLMQIMPLTQIEIAEQLSLQEAISPRNNIIAGIYYFHQLYSQVKGRTEVDRVKIALAAYNAGLSRIYDAQAIAQYLGEDPTDWGAIAQALTMLTKQNYTLHQRIWSDGKPPSGYFRGWKQTQSYVNDVIEMYNNYSLALR